MVVALLSLIILGLVAMFTQTQRAYKFGSAQVDVLEGGRAVTDMMTRELSQMAPSRASNCGQFLRRDSRSQFVPSSRRYPESASRPNQSDGGMYFLTRENNVWAAIAYQVLTNHPGTAAGRDRSRRWHALAYSDNAPIRRQPWWSFDTATNAFRNTPYTKLSHVVDGVVHFKVRAYDPYGIWITNSLFTNAFAWSVNNARYAEGEAEVYYFFNNIVPASVELELGILEERAAERARSIGDPVARAEFLAHQAGKVHLFRWRVPVRNVDPTAYQ